MLLSKIMDENAATKSNMPSGVSQYIPPKNWDELTADEKIERMREQIKYLSNSLGQAQATLHNLRGKLKRHSHHEGKVFEMKEVQDYDEGNGLIGLAKLANDKYF